MEKERQQADFPNKNPMLAAVIFYQGSMAALAGISMGNTSNGNLFFQSIIVAMLGRF
ncbi:hypothetical protein [Pseudomonas sp. FEN]|uniref:hypothetical protein n=1 Tax=Pseudomonas sp. FEN TaxID=2767468 RepID=UPI001749E7B1|nr:hypothetical protein [Pseudomonas sp. FEN]